MKKLNTGIALISILIITACSSLNTLTQNQDEDKEFKYRVQAGINHGGIVENTDMDELNNVAIDGFTGATKLGINAGAHVLVPAFNNHVEIGIDYMYNNQTFKYNDAISGYYGNRKIGTSQILFPITFNLGLFKQNNPEGLFQVKLGYALQYNIFNISDDGNTLPDYSTKSFSSGLVFGFTSAPYKFENGSRLGIYVDLYRGSQLYEDFYNNSSFKMPGSSFLKSGLYYQFN
jgi:hypothetical protein